MTTATGLFRSMTGEVMEILLAHDVHAGGSWRFISYGHDVLRHHFFNFHCFGRTIAEDDFIRKVALGNNACELRIDRR